MEYGLYINDDPRSFTILADVSDTPNGAVECKSCLDRVASSAELVRVGRAQRLAGRVRERAEPVEVIAVASAVALHETIKSIQSRGEKRFLVKQAERMEQEVP